MLAWLHVIFNAIQYSVGASRCCYINYDQLFSTCFSWYILYLALSLIKYIMACC